MSEFKVTGKITLIKEAESGQSKAGKQWSKQEFVVETTDEYNNLYCFQVFGDERVENLTKYNKVGDDVTVSFNVSTNEWKGKHFTSLGAWKIEKAANDLPPVTEDGGDTESASDDGDLPF